MVFNKLVGDSASTLSWLLAHSKSTTKLHYTVIERCNEIFNSYKKACKITEHDPSVGAKNG